MRIATDSCSPACHPSRYCDPPILPFSAWLRSPLHRTDSGASQTLVTGDVVKLHIGAHIDGFAAISAETLVVGATVEAPATGRKADVVKAAWTAAEAAMRLVKVGNKNWQVTDAVAKVASTWDCNPVEGRPPFTYVGAEK